jgi:error-prone DNA polymerase
MRATYDLEIEGNHNFLANDFVVHNSHAASFALIAYATSWLRRHYLAEFTCGLLNAQPMGFYQPATIVGDAQRHGLEIRPIDVNVSAWDGTIEGPAPAKPAPPGQAVRMGLRWVKGLALGDGERILAARAGRPFASVEDFARRARLEGRAYASLAEAGALGALAEGRRDALWQIAGWEKRQADALALGAAGAAWDGDGARFPGLDKLDEIFWDYRASDHSTRGHPLGPLRPHLRAQRLPDARTVARMRDGERVDYAGVVICRQRPGTASGVTFMTMEDETGFVNVVVWSQVFEANAVLVRTASLLGVSGRLQIQEGIVHVIADGFFTPELPRPIVAGQSRDFH